MYTIIQYSPTGNTAYLASKLGDALGTDTIHALEHLNYEDIKPCQHLIIMYAVHAFNAPKVVKDFIKHLPSGKAKYVSLVAVGCNDTWINDAATAEIQRMLTNKDYKVCVQKVIAMPLTLVMAFPEALIKEQIASSDEIIAALAADITACVVVSKDVAFKTKVIKKVGAIEPLAARFFGLELHAKKSCIQCELCVKNCPTKNIKMAQNGKIKFKFKCSMCLRCIYQCPRKSITPYVSKFIPIKEGYDINKYL